MLAPATRLEPARMIADIPETIDWYERVQSLEAGPRFARYAEARARLESAALSTLRRCCPPQRTRPARLRRREPFRLWSRSPLAAARGSRRCKSRCRGWTNSSTGHRRGAGRPCKPSAMPSRPRSSSGGRWPRRSARCGDSGGPRSCRYCGARPVSRSRSRTWSAWRRRRLLDAAGLRFTPLSVLLGPLAAQSLALADAQGAFSQWAESLGLR